MWSQDAKYKWRRFLARLEFLCLALKGVEAVRVHDEALRTHAYEVASKLRRLCIA